VYSKRILVLVCACAVAQEGPAFTFGTTTVSSSGLQGKLYLLDSRSEELPKFNKLRPVGTVYTTSLQITPRPFQQGFPGITDRFEWFAIDYTGRFFVDQPGIYKFRLLSDDGSKLYINDKVLIDNDGMHMPEAIDGSAEFSRGVYSIRVSYFQGPRNHVALVLSVARPGDDAWKIFDTNDFPPPVDENQWLNGKLSKIKRGSNF
jgi:hypothetical protein